MPFAFMAIASIAGGILNFMQARSAARKQEDLARKNEANQRAESERQARLEEKANLKEQAHSRAKAAASGAKIAGSIAGFLEEQEETGRERVEWIRRSGKSRADIIREEGELTADITRQQGFGNLIGGLGSGVEWGQKAGWF